MRIQSIYISNYRSFGPRSREDMNIDSLSAINIFVGPNGSGKTNFFNSLRDCIGWHSFNSQGLCRPESHYYQKDKPVDIIIEFADNSRSTFHRDAWLEGQLLPKPIRTPDVQTRKCRKERIYPIGLPHKFSEFNKIHQQEENKSRKQDRTYDKICRSWQKIREDAERIGGKLQENCPKEPVVHPNPDDNADRFFYDVMDDNGVPILEGSDGLAGFLLMVVKIRIREPGSVILIEEPEVSMHPGLQKQFLDYLKYLAGKEDNQFLINTHSPYLLNFAVSDETEEVAVFRLSKNAEDCTQIESVENKRTENWEILTDLGHSPADVLQAKGIVWVEGPSDLIYVSTWLEKLAPELRRGKDYEIMWYGGSNFVHLDVEITEQIREVLWKDKNTTDKLFSLFSLSKCWAFLVDSDSHRTNNWQKTMNEIKDELIKKCKQHGQFTWKVDPFIEECIQGKNKRPRGKSKVDWAREYQGEEEKATYSDCRLTPDARKKVDELICEIRKWR